MGKILKIVERAADGTVLSVQDRTLQRSEFSVQSSAFGGAAPPPPPTITEMLTNFAGAMLRWAGSGFSLVDEVAFRLRLEQCRACPHWEETARAGAGKCNHPKCGCTRAKLWLAAERCPIDRW